MFEPGRNNQPGKWTETLDGRELSQWRGGDVVRTPVSKPADYVELILEGMQGRPLAEIRRNVNIGAIPVPSPSSSRGAVTAVKDPKAGGVVVQFDPNMFAGEASEEEIQKLEVRYRAFLAKEGTGAALFKLKDRLN